MYRQSLRCDSSEYFPQWSEWGCVVWGGKTDLVSMQREPSDLSHSRSPCWPGPPGWGCMFLPRILSFFLLWSLCAVREAVVTCSPCSRVGVLFCLLDHGQSTLITHNFPTLETCLHCFCVFSQLLIYGSVDLWVFNLYYNILLLKLSRLWSLGLFQHTPASLWHIAINFLWGGEG